MATESETPGLKAYTFVCRICGDEKVFYWSVRYPPQQRARYNKQCWRCKKIVPHKLKLPKP